tara:strand:+ start:11219 stop:12544 length:1326 start_codon:yes stop_codon:yes gene_type:complete
MGKVVWFTGLSGSGKTTIAEGVQQQLQMNNFVVKILDADEVRSTLHQNLGFSREDIRLNNKLMAGLAKKYSEEHDFVLVPIISPFSEDRAMVRTMVGDNYIELYVNASLQQCQNRDVKGLYAKAASGEINNMIGVAEGNPYQPPTAPDIEVKTDQQTESQSSEFVVKSLLDTPKFSPELTIAMAAAKKAGLAVMKYYEENNFETNHKEDDSPITCADLESNRILMDELSKTEIPILSEEDKDIPGRTSMPRIWIIDPVDGTSDFIQHTGEFTIMIALIENNQPLLGVIYGPASDALYAWEKGKGAYKLNQDNWQELSSNSQESHSEMRIVASRNHLTNEEKQFFQSIEVKSITPKGSSFKAIDIASGNAEMYVTFAKKIKQWDTAAYYGLVHEAGGKVTDLDGNPFTYNTEDLHHKNGILITNGILHQSVIDKIKEYRNQH